MDLKKPVEEQIRLLRRHNLKGTFLLQYDALLREDIVGLLKAQPEGSFEYGAWLEVMQPLVEDTGLTWKGRYAWDWHTDVGFSISYTPRERERLVDTLMEKFKSVFGYYPKSVGSWIIDAHTLAYMAEKYGVAASCNCKDQWGTDGYTLWGGYYNQAYYPSRKNAFTPAQTREEQINLPVFRMLGSDPIYQYDTGLDGSFNPTDFQNVVTLEPVYEGGGGNRKWVEWYFKENFSGICLSFGYTQSGQENSFGWEGMKKGLTIQFDLIAKKAAAKEICVQTLAESGEWYRSKYALTPASVVAAMSDWKNEGRQSVWYSSRFYRVNLYWEKGHFHIRDLYLFNEAYEERYLQEKCTTPSCVYDNLPVMDGNRWSGNHVCAGIYPVLADGSALKGGLPSVETAGDEELTAHWPLSGGGTFAIRCLPETIEISLDGAPSWELCFVTAGKAKLPETQVSEKSVSLKSSGFSYAFSAEEGSFRGKEGLSGLRVFPQDSRIVLRVAGK